jgi:hypothetical protein
MLASEKIVIESPMSWTGSAKRIWRLSENVWVRWLVLVWLIALAWSVIAVWYLMFGLLLVPWRLIRRSHRKGKLEAVRHKELLEHAQKSGASEH